MSAKIPIGKKSPISWKDSITFAELDYHTTFAIVAKKQIAYEQLPKHSIIKIF